MLKDLTVFLGEFRRKFATTGAVLPSSPVLARAMAQPLQKRGPEPIKVLEVGPGTGAFTTRILKLLHPGDELDIIELNRNFYEHLKQKLDQISRPEKGVRVHLHHGDIREFQSPHRYDFIICALPFANFESEVVVEIMDGLLNRLQPEGVFSYFEYSLPHWLKLCFVKPNEHDRIKRTRQTVRHYKRKHQFKCRHVWLNFPPGHARHLKKHGNEPGQGK